MRHSFAMSGQQNPLSSPITRARDVDSQMSEEEKDAILFRKFIYRKKMQRLNKNSKNKIGGQGDGTDAYLDLIKRNFDMINEKEEEIRQRYKQEYIKEAKGR